MDLSDISYTIQKRDASKIKGVGITSFVLHFIAMGLMLCDHLWGTFCGNYEWLGWLGRIAFPLFAFMLVEGFVHTGNRKKYAFRMFLFALISELPFNLMMEHRFFNPFHQNVLWTFLIGIGMLSLYEKIKTRKNIFVRLALYALTTIGGYLLGFIGFVDYFGYGILLIGLFYFTRIHSDMKPCCKIILCLIQLAGMYIINCEMMKGMLIPISVFGFELEIYKQGLAILSLPFIWLYNGKQGVYNKTVKNIYYWFYPVHMFVLGGLITVL